MTDNTEPALNLENIAPTSTSVRSVIHDINNPLSSIIGNAQLLLMRESELDRRTVEKLKKIEADALRIDAILKTLRDSIKG